jgi:hypothetical protein
VIPNRVATSCVLANCARCCTPRSQCQSAIAVVRLRFGHITEIEGGASELVSCHRRSIGPGASDDEFVDADVADGEAQHIGQNRRGEGDCRGCFGVLVDPSLDELDARRRTGSAEVNGAGMVLDSRALGGRWSKRGRRQRDRRLPHLPASRRGLLPARGRGRKLTTRAADH